MSYGIAYMFKQQLKQELVKLAQLPASVKVSRMLASFKAYKRRVFKPDPHVILLFTWNLCWKLVNVV